MPGPVGADVSKAGAYFSFMGNYLFGAGNRLFFQHMRANPNSLAYI